MSILGGNETFYKEFIEQGGLNGLIQLLRTSKWQIVAVTLDIIPKLYSYEYAIDFMKQNTHIYTNMWETIADRNKNVR